MRALLIPLLVLLAGAAPEATTPTATPTPTPTPTLAPKPLYLVVYKPGPAWIAGKSRFEQPLKEHGRYMLGLYAEGRLRFAGGFDDLLGGGAAAFEATDEAEARAVVAKDPAVTAGVMVPEIRPWALVDWGSYLQKSRATTP